MTFEFVMKPIVIGDQEGVVTDNVLVRMQTLLTSQSFDGEPSVGHGWTRMKTRWATDAEIEAAGMDSDDLEDEALSHAPEDCEIPLCANCHQRVDLCQGECR